MLCCAYAGLSGEYDSDVALAVPEWPGCGVDCEAVVVAV